MVNHRSFNILGNIAVVNFSDGTKSLEKKKFAKEILEKNKIIKTVLEKSGRFSGRLRKMETKHLAGEKNKEVLYKENNCTFRFNIDTTYFSPRLSNERKEISSLIQKNSTVLVMFAGVAPFSIVIAKNSKPKEIYSNEINREANKYAEINAEINGVKNKINFVNGDIKKIAFKLKGQGKNFDYIVMPRPNLKESFLEQAFMLSKKGTKIYYYDFCKVDETDLIVKKIKEQAEKFKFSIKILNVKSAGETAPYKIRVRVDFEII
ncbi:MAG: class I SAM-dependent methyltransferase [Nanobdellota archaeon]